MQSFHIHSLLSNSCPNINNLNSHPYKPKIKHSPLHNPYPHDNHFSDALLSLRTCTEYKNSKLGSCFHAKIMKLGLENDVFIGNSLLHMYAKSDQIKDAENLFDHMPQRSIVSWTSMMSAYCHNKLADETILLFFRMLEYLQPNEFTLAVVLQACALKGDKNLVEVIQSCAIKTGLIFDEFLQTSLIDAYAKSGMLGAAESLLQRQSHRDVVSWTSVISGCVCNGYAERALVLFFGMQEDGIFPTEITMLSVLQACSIINNLKILNWVLGLVFKGGWYKSCLVLNSLIEMYSTNGYFSNSMIIFSRFCFNGDGLYPSSETMANLLQGCGNFGRLKLGEEVHGYLIKLGFLPCTIVENSLMNMYLENGDEDSALLLFRTMANKDIVSWNTIIRCFVKYEHPVDALRLLSEVHREGSWNNVSPDFVTMLTSLQACSELALLPQGQMIHGYLTRTGLVNDIFIYNSLIDMYAKSGSLNFAEKIFDEMPERDIGSWNSIIAAYGINGNGISSLKIFSLLKKSGNMKPNAITFVNIISACAHSGLVEEGLEIFHSMERDHSIKPSMNHFSCMVDLLGRAGRVEEAEAFIYKMPVQPSADVWGALLSACVLVGNVIIAERAAKELSFLEPNSSVWRVALSNAYAAVGKWNEVGKIRAELRGSKKLKKEGGWSSVNVEGREFRFMAGDTKHLESVMIYKIVDRLQNHMQEASVLCCK